MSQDRVHMNDITRVPNISLDSRHELIKCVIKKKKCVKVKTTFVYMERVTRWELICFMVIQIEGSNHKKVTEHTFDYHHLNWNH